MTLLNKAVLGGLTLGDVFRLIENRIAAIEVHIHHTRTKRFHQWRLDDELEFWFYGEDDPDMTFPLDLEVNIKDGALEFECDGNTISLILFENHEIDLLEAISSEKLPPEGA